MNTTQPTQQQAHRPACLNFVARLVVAEHWDLNYTHQEVLLQAQEWLRQDMAPCTCSRYVRGGGR